MRDVQERRPVVATLSPTRLNRRRLLVPGVAALVIGADQATKSWAVGSLSEATPRHIIGPANFVLTFNSGAAFSLGRGITPIVEAVVVVLIVWLLLIGGRASRTASTLASIGMGLLLGGALSNLADRLFRHHHGAVVDFIQAVSWWPVFNVADASIVIGVIGLVVAYRDGDRVRA